MFNKDSCASSKTKSKGPKCHDHHTHILEPDNKNNILTEEIDIKTSLQQHFSSIGKNERIDLSFKSKVSECVYNIKTNKITRESISEILLALQFSRAMDYDEIPMRAIR